jgi:hypothetical protein
VHNNLTFMKRIYMYMNINVIIMRPTFVQQERGVRIWEARVDQSRSIYHLFQKKHVKVSSDTTRLVIKCSILHVII